MPGREVGRRHRRLPRRCGSGRARPSAGRRRPRARRSGRRGGSSPTSRRAARRRRSSCGSRSAFGSRAVSHVGMTWSLTRRRARQVLVRIVDLAGDAAHDDAAVVHRVVERAAPDDHPVDDRDGDADVLADGGAQRGVGDGAVDVEPLVGAPVGHRQHDRAVRRRHADVGDQPGVEHLEDGVAVVLGADRATAEADAVGGRFGGHGRHLGPAPSPIRAGIVPGRDPSRKAGRIPPRWWTASGRRDERRDRGEHVDGCLQVRGVADAGQQQHLAGPADGGGDQVDLARRPVRVGVALDDEHRRGDRRQPIGDVPRAERGRQPDVVPAAERRVDVVVVAGQAVPQVRRRVGVRAAAIDETLTSSTTTCGAIATSPATGRPAPACSRAIDAPSLWPTSTGRSIPRSASSAGSTTSASWCMYGHRPRQRRRSAVAVARPGVRDDAPTGRLVQRGRHAAPELDAAEPLVQQDERRLVARPIDDVELDARDDHAAVTPAGGRAGRSAGSCRSPSSGSSSTTWTWRGRLNAAIRARQWASIDAGVDRAALAGDDEGDGHLQPGGVAGPDDGRLEHVGVLDEHGLDLGRRHPDPAGLDHVAVAPEERPVAVGGARVDVAGRQPLALERGAGRGVAAPVPGGQRRARTWR